MTATTADISTFRFTANDLHKRDGLAVWREMIGRLVLRVDLSTLPDLPFHSEVIARASAGVRIAYATESGLRMERSREFIADGIDDVALHSCMAGRWIVSSRGREVALEAGEAVLVSDAEVASVTTPSLAQAICIQVPRRLLAPFVPNPEDALMRPIPRQSEALRLLFSYAGALRAVEPLMEPALQRLVATHLRDLVAVALGANRDAVAAAEQGGIRAARLGAIKGYVVQNLEDDTLSAAATAAHHQVSPRYVQALFEREGTTFSAYVASQRLARAHELLTDPRNARRPVADIAFAVGFGDLSYFNRSFRRQYGATPLEVRAAAMARALDESRS